MSIRMECEGVEWSVKKQCERNGMMCRSEWSVKEWNGVCEGVEWSVKPPTVFVFLNMYADC